mmetsp:Transcript_25995/g.72608  ORF Transcript_25995/g.72608 Transcript_25995/m.72608 type:complete len:267 (-) Transcript_25995:384-1184(-)
MIGFAWGIDRSATGMAKTGTERERVLDMQAAVAEFIAMTVFVIVGCGVACGNGASDGETRLLVAFAFGMCIMVLAYSIGPHSGGQINCAVTFSLVLGGQVPWWQGLVNAAFQFMGSVVGALVLCIIFPCELDKTGSLGTNVVDTAYGEGRAFVGEIFGTFLLCYVVWETAVSPKATCGINACIAIGFTVFIAHLLLLPIDGCSINPTRSFGPAIVSSIRTCEGKGPDGEGLQHFWVMLFGPLIGAALATALKFAFVPNRSDVKPFN